MRYGCCVVTEAGNNNLRALGGHGDGWRRHLEVSTSATREGMERRSSADVGVDRDWEDEVLFLPIQHTHAYQLIFATALSAA